MEKNNNKIALVIGGSRGIGRAVALRLAESGCDIWLTYKSSHEEADAVRKEIEAKGKGCRLFCFDISDYEQTASALGKAVEEISPYILVFNAGIRKDNLLMWMTREEWDSVLSTNLDGFYNITRNVIFSMLRAKQGRVVVISSASGQSGQQGQVNYSASKAGLIGAAKALAREVGKRNISVNVVAPGFIETDMTAGIPKESVLPLIPLNRLGNVEDVASVVNFLCTEKHMYIHGEVISVSGGLVM